MEPMNPFRTDRIYFVFDVLTLGPLGDAYWAAWCVIGAEGKQLGEGCASCSPLAAKGGRAARYRHCVTGKPTRYGCDTPEQVRDRFWYAWSQWEARGATAAAIDPCHKARIFHQAAADDESRVADMPAGVLDIDTLDVLIGRESGGQDRKTGELDGGDPTNTARFAARMLAEGLSWQQTLRAKAEEYDSLAGQLRASPALIHAGPEPGADVELPTAEESAAVRRLLRTGWEPQDGAHCPACLEFDRLLDAARERFAPASAAKPAMPMEET